MRNFDRNGFFRKFKFLIEEYVSDNPLYYYFWTNNNHVGGSDIL